VAPADAGPDASVETDAGGFETGTFDATELEGTTGLGEDGGAPPPARLLLSASAATQSELAVFGLQSAAVDGRITYAGSFGTTTTTSSSPWLLEPTTDVVARLDPIQPWIVRSTWNVALSDATDAGVTTPYSYPDAVILGAGANAYVLRYTRNHIAVIDTSADVDGGVPSSTIDLSGQVQPGGDGYVEMTAGYFDPASNDAFILLGNINRSAVASDGSLLCAGTNPTVVAIDTATNALVSLGDAGIHGALLQGYAPTLGPSPMVYDPANDRLLVLESGCTMGEGDGGLGPVTRRGVEAVSLVDGSVTQLIDLTTQSTPRAIFYVDAHHVILQLATAFMWDPSSTMLGAAIPGAPAAFTVDGEGNLIGVDPQLAADGGHGWNIISVDVADGGVTTLGQNPFILSSGVVSGVQLWPSP
jgi:hypothetical protein